VLGETESLLYRRGNFNGTFDDLICDALLQERDADIALSPGFRWGTSLLPGDKITREDLFNATAMSYPAAYRTEMTGEMLHTLLEDVADNLFNPTPTTSRAATWCASAAWATASTSTPRWARASPR
jgi:sulfur-oxidizing protein SoxB